MFPFRCIIILCFIVEVIAFNVPNTIIKPPRSSHVPFLATTSNNNDSWNIITDCDLKHEDRIPVIISSVLTLDRVDTSSSNAIVRERRNNEKVYESIHSTDHWLVDDHFQKWILKLYNDSDNTRSRVCQCLVTITGLSEEESYTKMMHAHRHGEAIIGEYCQERAEHYKEALLKCGLVCDVISTGGV